MSGEIDLWNAQTWTLTGVLTQVTGTAIGTSPSVPRSRYVAVGNYDGSGGVWSVDPHEELVPISGRDSRPQHHRVQPRRRRRGRRGQRRDGAVYRAGGPWTTTLAATPLCGCGNEIGWQSEKMTATTRSGSDIELQTWMLPSGRLVPGSPVLSTDQQDDGVVVSDDGRLAATWDDQAPTSTVQVADGSTGRAVFTLPATTVQDVTFTPDDRFLVVVDSSGGLHVVDLADHRVVVGHGWPQSCPGGGDPPAISAHDALVAVYTFCGQVTVGHLADARPFETFNQHQQLSRIAFDPAGHRLALASWDSCGDRGGRNHRPARPQGSPSVMPGG